MSQGFNHSPELFDRIAKAARSELPCAAGIPVDTVRKIVAFAFERAETDKGGTDKAGVQTARPVCFAVPPPLDPDRSLSGSGAKP